MSLTVRPVAPDERREWAVAVWQGFGEHPDEEGIASAMSWAAADRALGAFDGRRLVGTALWFPSALTLPGGADVPVSALTDVTVLPTHRRRGLLRRMMEVMLREVRSGPVAASVLVASEATIYGRFGYGPATRWWRLRARRAGLDLRPPAGGEPAGPFRLIPDEEAADVLPALHEAHRRRGTGDIARDGHWWRFHLDDLIARRQGRPRRFHAVLDGDGGPAAAASYRIVHGDTSALDVTEVLAASDAAERAAWRYLAGVDGVEEIRVGQAPQDAVLRMMAVDPRAVAVTGDGDGLWLRPLDVPALLTARAYTARDELVVEVAEPGVTAPGGRFALSAGPDGAECARTRRRPDVTLAVADLGSALLGGTAVAALARGGRVAEHRAGAAARLGALLAWTPAPFLGTEF